jgi:lipopolysaccharide export system protein LptC
MSSPTADLPGHGLPSPDLPGLAAEDIERRRRLLQQWRRHSALIAVLRKLLPALCLAILAALAGWAVVNTLGARKEGARIPNAEIRMVGINFQGRTEAGKPYLVTSASAMRDNADTAKVTLEKPVLTLGVGGPEWTTVKAGQGVYREDTRMLDLRGKVTLDDYRGNHLVTEHALVDTTKSNVDGDTPIAGQGPLGSIQASSYSLRGGGTYLHFEGGVKARIVQHQQTAPAPAPAGH